MDQVDQADQAGLVCAIHQPNFFPRLSTLAKLFAADVWIVLDDVQFNGRDYQHRCRLAALGDTSQQQWLTLPAHRPDGRATLIGDVRLVDPDLAGRRTHRMLQQYYRRSRHWPSIHQPLQQVLGALQRTSRLADIAQGSTCELLRLLGWTGRIYSSSNLRARQGRCERLADLVHCVGAHTYLCGTGGWRYLDPRPFAALGIGIEPFTIPEHGNPAVWAQARHVTALTALATAGQDVTARELNDHAGKRVDPGSAAVSAYDLNQPPAAPAHRTTLRAPAYDLSAGSDHHTAGLPDYAT